VFFVTLVSRAILLLRTRLPKPEFTASEKRQLDWRRQTSVSQSVDP